MGSGGGKDQETVTRALVRFHHLHISSTLQGARTMPLRGQAKPFVGSLTEQRSALCPAGFPAPTLGTTGSHLCT